MYVFISIYLLHLYTLALCLDCILIYVVSFVSDVSLCPLLFMNRDGLLFELENGKPRLILLRHGERCLLSTSLTRPPAPPHLYSASYSYVICTFTLEVSQYDGTADAVIIRR